jgi:hypothetical protein
MIRRVKKQYPALVPLRRSLSASLVYSLLICLIATILPLYESVNVWTLLLFMLTAAVALPYILPRLREAVGQKAFVPNHAPHVSHIKTLKKYDRALHASLLGSLGFIAYYLYFATRSISGYGVDMSSAEHASATTLAYLTIFLGCAVSVVAYRKNQNKVLGIALLGFSIFIALPYVQLGRSIGFGKLSATDIAVSFSLSLVYAALLYLLHHGRTHTREALLADHSTETVAHHAAKR